MSLVRRYSRARLGGIDSGRKEGFVRVDVADADDLPLVHQHLLDRLFRRRQDGGEAGRGESRIERFGAERRIVAGPALVIEQQNCAQATHVAVDQLASVVERGAEDGVAGLTGHQWPVGDGQRACHSRLDDQA